MLTFNITIDKKRWLRGNTKQRKHIIEARRVSSRSIADFIVMEAKARVPKDTYDLYNSIRSVITPNGAYVIADATNGNGDAYAKFVEYGTGIYNVNGTGRKTPWLYEHRDGRFVLTQGVAARPFMSTAVDLTILNSSKILKGAWNRIGISNR